MYKIILILILAFITSCDIYQEEKESETYPYFDWLNLNSVVIETKNISDLEIFYNGQSFIEYRGLNQPYISLSYPDYINSFQATINSNHNIEFNPVNGDTVKINLNLDKSGPLPYPVPFYFKSRNLYTYKFEDLHPNKGDYDFNDYILKSDVYIYSDMHLKPFYIYVETIVYNIGSSIPFGLGIQFFGAQGDNWRYQGYNAVEANSGVISGKDNAFIIHDNLMSLTPRINSFSGEISVPDTIKYSFNVNSEDLHPSIGIFSNLIPVHYIFKTDNNEHEIQVSGIPPTPSASHDFFNTGDDISSPFGWNRNPGRVFSLPAPFYFTKEGFPWGIKILTVSDEISWAAKEGVSIKEAFPQFEWWVISGGSENKTWFLNPNPDFIIADN